MGVPFKVYFFSWIALGMVVVALAIYRKMLIKREDVNLHVFDQDAGLIPQQATMAHRIEVVDRWGKILTTVEVVYGIAIGAMYLYAVWLLSQKTSWSE